VATKNQTAIESSGPAQQPEPPPARSRVHAKRDIPTLGTRPTDFARMFQISRAAVYSAIARGEIPSIRIAGIVRIPMKFVTDALRNAERDADENRRA
jgi:hypothetical protein